MLLITQLVLEQLFEFMNDSQEPSEFLLELVNHCEERLGYRFGDASLLYEAVTHASSSRTRLKSYERLEFLGDSILGFIVCEFLFYKFPQWLEGDLTKIKSIVVSRRTCGRLGKRLGIEQLLVVGKGLEQKGEVPNSLLANAFESLLGAIYLDGGLDAVKTFLVPMVEVEVEAAVSGDSISNYKSELQQYAQKFYGKSS